MANKGQSIVEELRAWGLTLPGAHRKSPWPEHDDLAVGDKTFAYLPPEDQIPDFDRLRDWIEESYRAQAPRKLVKELDARP